MAFGSLVPDESVSDPEMLANFARNSPYTKLPSGPISTPYNTRLDPVSELAFRGWLIQNNVPFQPDTKVTDYDMRGFYKGLIGGHPMAKQAFDQIDNRMHYSDYWKTPYHETFSGAGGPYSQGSQWAGPVAPQWNAQNQLISPSGKIMFDDKAQRDSASLIGLLRGMR